MFLIPARFTDYITPQATFTDDRQRLSDNSRVNCRSDQKGKVAGQIPNLFGRVAQCPVSALIENMGIPRVNSDND